MMRQAYIAYSLPMVTATLFDEHIEAGSDGEFYTSLIWLAALLFTQAALSILHGWYNPSGEDFKPVFMGELTKHFLNVPIEKSEKMAPGFSTATWAVR
eukprot:601838-Pyramimonas_sp.AAC.2